MPPRDADRVDPGVALGVSADDDEDTVHEDVRFLVQGYQARRHDRGSSIRSGDLSTLSTLFVSLPPTARSSGRPVLFFRVTVSDDLHECAGSRTGSVSCLSSVHSHERPFFTI
jgi:hypothetical protein